MSEKKKVVLAFSGGLDTSFCVKYLSEDLGYEIHSVLVDTGGFSAEDLKAIEARAYSLGVKAHATISKTDDYYNQCIKYLIFGNILKNNTYPLSVSAERIFQAIAAAEFAKKIGAQAIAHGSTGAGNDQVRFDMAFRIIMPEAEIITPIRDNKLSREEEIAYLKKHGVEIDAQKKVALAEVKAEVSKLSLEIAQKVLNRELDSTKDQQTYINSLVDKLN